MVNFVVTANHWVKVKEGEKLDKKLDLVRELKNVQVTVMFIVHGALRTISKNLENEIGWTGDEKNWNNPDHSTIKIGEDTQSWMPWGKLLSLRRQRKSISIKNLHEKKNLLDEKWLYIKEKIDDKQNNNNCWLYDDQMKELIT